jgi:hypothetical protein
MTVAEPIRSMECSPKPSRPTTWLAKRQIAQRRSKSFQEKLRAFRTKTRMVVGTTKRRQAVIDPRPTSRAEGIQVKARGSWMPRIDRGPARSPIVAILSSEMGGGPSIGGNVGK